MSPSHGQPVEDWVTQPGEWIMPETIALLLLHGWRYLSGKPTWGFFLINWTLGLWWLTQLGMYVGRPYLDEVFHIPQAQAYCEGKLEVWDDKITTPPGLYLLAALYHKVFRNGVCTVHGLRRLNLYGVTFIHLVAASCRQHIEARIAPRASPTRASSYAYHAGVNIALFPVLFFFSGLFYTDVYSALFVLLAYQNHLSRLSRHTGILSDIWTMCLGVSTLLMRQTNVFWVVVYMGGLEAVHAVKSLKPKAVETPQLTTLWSVARFYGWKYSLGHIHDPPLSVSWPDDWVFCGLSIAIAAICNPGKVLRQIWPFLSVAGIFAAFVAWNRGVVLGDKSNHVATIHLAQMLYLWPLMAFFSAPLLIPAALQLPLTIYEFLFKAKTVSKAPASPAQTASLRLCAFFIRKLFYPCVLLGTAALAGGIVKYNTIIHPFTLADNRHYMFYVFRYTILRSQAIRFALVPAYIIAAYVVWNRLAGNPGSATADHVQQHEHINRPFGQATLSAPTGKPEASSVADRNKHNSEQGAAPLPSPPTLSPPTSTALLWLATTALSLISAPLVEPRYFILPWIFWRLLVPALYTPASKTAPPPWSSSRLLTWARTTDLTAVLETAWFVVVNLVTFRVFIRYPFVWPQDAGLGAGVAPQQRFMW